MNIFDKYKKIVQSLDILYISPLMFEQGVRFNVTITGTYNFISFNSDVLLFTDTVDKEKEFKEILELCKLRYESYVFEIIKYKIK